MTRPKKQPVPARVNLLVPPSGGPHEQRLAQATREFRVGDFRSACRAAEAVQRDSDAGDAERQFAAEVIRRTRMDPAALVIGLACLLSFVLLVSIFPGH